MLPKKLIEPLARVVKPYQKLLLAMSGGSDSAALFHCLRSMNKQLGVAHVDHGWRSESLSEATQLKQKMDKEGIPFYLKKLDPQYLVGNLEQACREARIQFFAEICEQEQYEAVLFAHHRDDLAETMMKRIFEGASWQGLVGMTEKTQIGSLIILRPWLSLPKKEILHFLEKEGVIFFSDATNLDAKFLRGRMRTQIFPLVEKSFGKTISAPLARLSQEVQELNCWMRDKYSSYLEKKYLDFSSIESVFERRWVLRAWFKNRSIEISYQVADTVLDLIETEAANKRIRLGKCIIEIDRQRLFLRSINGKVSTVTIKNGIQWGNWLITLQKYNGQSIPKKGWEAALEGELSTTLPEGDFQMGCYQDALNDVEKKPLQKLWTDNKVPGFLRDNVPIISQNGQLVKEFLTRSSQIDVSSGYLLKLKAFTTNGFVC